MRGWTPCCAGRSWRTTPLRSRFAAASPALACATVHSLHSVPRTPLQYGIDAKVRNNGDLARRGVEDMVKDKVAAAHVPMYRGTDLFVVVQVFKVRVPPPHHSRRQPMALVSRAASRPMVAARAQTIAGMAIVRDYMTLRRYSAQVEGDTAVPAGATMASEKEGPKIEISDEEGAVRMPESGAHIRFRYEAPARANPLDTA